jgi:simple sugar transport system permease protein
MKHIRNYFIENVIVILFIILAAIAIPISGLPGSYLLQEILKSLGRDSLFVIALLLPILAGMGLNFGIVLGAIAGEIGLIYVVVWQVPATPAFLLAMLITLLISVLLGWMCGRVMNIVKGREMITGYILAIIMGSVYMLFTRYGLGRTIADMNLLKVWLALDKTIPLRILGLHIPVLNYLFVAAACVFTIWFRRTKLGLDMKAVGEDKTAAAAAGIDVDRTRIMAIIISTVLAGFGQIVYLLSTGSLSSEFAHSPNISYSFTALIIGSEFTHSPAVLYSIAALIIGGAHINKASISNAFIGVVLFNLLFIASLSVSKNLMGSDVLGNYLSQLVIYGVIVLSIVMYVRKGAPKEEHPSVPLLCVDEKAASYDINKFGILRTVVVVCLLWLFLTAPMVGITLDAALHKVLYAIGMNGIMVLALVPMIQSGCGLNFGLAVGIIAGQLGAVICIEMGYVGALGFMLAILISQVFSVIFGLGYGALLNRVKGEEMIASVFAGISFFMLMSIAWLTLPFTSLVMSKEHGSVGLWQIIYLKGFWAPILDSSLSIQVSSFSFLSGPILFFIFIAFIVWAFFRSRIGKAITATGSNPALASASGINVNRMRTLSVVISTMLGALGIIVFQQCKGIIELDEPLYMASAAVAAIIIGGAGINKASFTNVLIGVVLYQGIITLTPLVYYAIFQIYILRGLIGTILMIFTCCIILYALTRKDEVIK